jgi:hypothetical protein
MITEFVNEALARKIRAEHQAYSMAVFPQGTQPNPTHPLLSPLPPPLTPLQAPCTSNSTPTARK